MTFTGKGLYNLLRNNWKKDPSLAVKPWQIEDYRNAKDEELFARLKSFGISLNRESFLLFGETCESPEELLECLWVGEDDIESQDQVYLLLFEIWRRLLPEKRSLSIFCDELDRCIEHYSEQLPEAEEEVLTILHEMEDILDENVDLGSDAKVIFSSMAALCAHDLEAFLYDFIIDQIESNNVVCASEILDGFYGYIGDSKWFDLLRARLFSLTSPEEASFIFAGLLEQLEDDFDVDFLLEITAYLSTGDDHELFAEAIKLGVNSLQDDEDLRDLFDILREYYRCLDKDDKVQEIDVLLKEPSLNNQKSRLFKVFE